MIQWHTQAGSITTNLNVKVDFTLPEISAKKIVVSDWHVDNSAKDRHDRILGRYILKALVLNLKLSDHVIELDYEPFKGFMVPMVDLGTYEF